MRLKIQSEFYPPPPQFFEGIYIEKKVKNFNKQVEKYITLIMVCITSIGRIVLKPIILFLQTQNVKLKKHNPDWQICTSEMQQNVKLKKTQPR